MVPLDSIMVQRLASEKIAIQHVLNFMSPKKTCDYALGTLQPQFEHLCDPQLGSCLKTLLGYKSPKHTYCAAEFFVEGLLATSCKGPLLNEDDYIYGIQCRSLFKFQSYAVLSLSAKYISFHQVKSFMLYYVHTTYLIYSKMLNNTHSVVD